jgi:hypothetical protein
MKKLLLFLSMLLISTSVFAYDVEYKNNTVTINYLQTVYK